MTVLGVCAIVIMVIASISFSIAIVGMTCQMIKDCWKKKKIGKSRYLWNNIRQTKLKIRMDKYDKLTMRCIKFTDLRYKTVNLRVPLNKCKCINVPKGLTLTDLLDRKEYIGRKFVLKVDYSDKKEEDV